MTVGQAGRVYTGYLHMHPTKRASKADGIKLGCSFVPGPRLNTFMSKGSSLPACRASNSRFSRPVAWSNGSLITKNYKKIKSINRKDPAETCAGEKGYWWSLFTFFHRFQPSQRQIPMNRITMQLNKYLSCIVITDLSDSDGFSDAVCYATNETKRK